MGKVLKFDMSDVEPGQDFDTPIPKGIYKMKINEIVDAPSKSDGGAMYTVELEIIKGDWKGRRLWDYIKYEDDSSQWKLRQLLEATGVLKKNGKQTGSFNPAKYDGKVVVVRVKHETDEDYNDGEPQAKVGSMQPLPEDAPEEEEPEGEEEATAAEPEAEASGDEPEEITAASVREMDLDELKELSEEQGIEVKFTKRSKVGTKRDEVIEALELVDVVEDPESWDELVELDREQLEAYIDQEELEIDATEHEEDDDLREAIAAELEIEVPETEESGGDAPDYSAMSVAELKETCKEQGLETKGGKKGMLKRLEAEAKSGSAEGESEPF